MNIHDFTLFSDHCSNLYYDKSIFSNDDSLKSFAFDTFVWSEQAKLKFKETFASPVIQNKPNSLNMIAEENGQDIDNLISVMMLSYLQGREASSENV